MLVPRRTEVVSLKSNMKRFYKITRMTCEMLGMIIQIGVEKKHAASCSQLVPIVYVAHINNIAIMKHCDTSFSLSG